MRRAFAILLCACGTTPAPAAPKCDVVMNGDLDASASLAKCATISSDDAGESALVVDTTTAELGHVRASVGLGAAPVPGPLSSESVTTWSAVETTAADGGCVYAAGSDIVPHGSFSLDWKQDDAGSPHGTLDVTLAVHAPPDSSCGPSDVEYLHVTF